MERTFKQEEELPKLGKGDAFHGEGTPRRRPGRQASPAEIEGQLIALTGRNTVTELRDAICRLTSMK